MTIVSSIRRWAERISAKVWRLQPHFGHRCDNPLIYPLNIA
jgi:hypothetical protein